MRVFEVFHYNLNEIKFKQNKEFFDKVLEEHGFEYTDISFIFNDDDINGELYKKAIKLFPTFEEYLFHYTSQETHQHYKEKQRLSSVFLKQDGSLNCSIKREHHQVFGELLKKIPHSLNFSFMGVVLDKINWYNDDCVNDALLNNENDLIITNSRFDHYLSNSVRFFKEFDYGNKLNCIKVLIDRTKDSESLREYPERFEKFLELFGGSYYKELICGFDESERKALEDAKQVIEALKRSKDYSHHFAHFENNKFNLENSITPISGYSPKSVLNKVAKFNNYKYIKCQNGFYIFKKTTENNHTYVVELNFKPFSLYADVSISVQGYNFTHYIYTYRDILAKDKEDLEKYTKAAFEAANEIEYDISKKLYTLYGKTPDWFI